MMSITMSYHETHQVYSAGVLTISDKGSQGERVDSAGEYICQTLKDLHVEITKYEIVPDEFKDISMTLELWADTLGVGFYSYYGWYA